MENNFSDSPITDVIINSINKAPKRAQKMFRRSKRLLKAYNFPQSQVLTPIDRILDNEDDFKLLTMEQRRYREALTSDRTFLSLYQTMTRCGFSDDYMRKVLFQPSADNLIVDLLAIIDPEKLKKEAQTLRTLFASYARINKDYSDEDDEYMFELFKEETIGVDDVLREYIRSRSENLSLIDLQIDWLKKEKKRDRKAKQHQPKPVIFSQDVSPIQIVEQQPKSIDPEPSEEDNSDFLLNGWDLFWTKSYYSTEDNHLEPVPTDRRLASIQELDRLGRKQISVKPSSVIKALEFHLRRDVIQKSLAARNKYGPEGVRDWVKIKRGRDRIFLYIPDPNQARAIFFVAGRDEVYKQL